MYQQLFTKINATLDSVTEVKEYFNYPKKQTKYPAVFYKPMSLENTFETNRENAKVYRFLIVVMVGAKQAGLEDAVTVLTKTVDAVIAQFDEDWNKGTIDGHRVSARLESVDPLEVSEEEVGLVAYMGMTLQIKLLSNI